MLQEYHIHLKITRSRRSRLGTYIAPYQRNYHTITINGDLNKYEFLEVFLHEYAHLLVRINYSYYTQPHGIEWKNCCRDLFHYFIRKNLFPHDICLALQDLMVKMPAASTANIEGILERYGTRKDFVEKFNFCCN